MFEAVSAIHPPSMSSTLNLSRPKTSTKTGRIYERYVSFTSMNLDAKKDGDSQTLHVIRKKNDLPIRRLQALKCVYFMALLSTLSKGLIRPCSGKPMVNKPSKKPIFLLGVVLMGDMIIGGLPVKTHRFPKNAAAADLRDFLSKSVTSHYPGPDHRVPWSL